ncbi:SGNH/GDSL hydrolase family protein [Planktothrix mougeotii]|uniref:SGNH/GDSL hydrolase family protein n=1 Tax=Planktothrix mougeotii LEGE 06226 TaxID=1828728 RepID=A0ABR9UAI5_9CYAN|nr:SGNH/GDSL hydrolase family protein [Planktothrix mougeotii]MBE9143460.1 SGNH/GDSL hydrolase family protein [Planktothrix mougeotii LEGE 06226]
MLVKHETGLSEVQATMMNISTASCFFALSVGGSIAFTITGINTAQAATFSSINIFGDSLSDPGNIYNLTGGAFPPAPYYDQGRFSNGDIWTDYLAEDLGLNPGSPSSQWVNYAFGGATTGTENIAYIFNPALTGLPGVQTQVLYAQQNKPADPNGLYIIWAGGNDYTYAGSDNTEEVVNNLSWSINTLYSVGARNFLIGNLPDLSKSPLGSSNPGDLQQTVKDHNALLKTKIKELNKSLFNSNIALFDVNNLFEDVIKKPSKYGLTNVTDRCLPPIDPQVPTVPCTNPNEYLFWDDLHPTTAGHKLIADAAYATIEKEFGSKSVPEPSTVLALTGLGLGLLLKTKKIGVKK